MIAATPREASRESSRPPQPSASPILPSVKVEPGFLCGLEFDSLSSELAFFRATASASTTPRSSPLQPGELLLFDNLALAHGRRGTRQPGELRQRVFGHHLQPATQSELRDRVLAAFYAAQSAELA